jgi:hypothetical protein
MANKNQFTIEDFINAMPGTGGIIKTIAQKVGCDWHTAKKYITRFATIAHAYAAEKESVKDDVENSLIVKAKEGDVGAIKYYLSTQAKDRGYVEKSQIELIQKELEGFLDLLEKQLEPKTYERILNLLANSG